MIDPSGLSLLRTLISLMHIDGDAHPREIKWLHGLIARQKLSPEQKSILEQDFKDPPPFRQVFCHVRLDQDRIELLQFAKILFKIDGRVHPKEREAYERLREIHSELMGSDERARAELAEELIKSGTRNDLYGELKEFGEILSRQVGFLAMLFPFLAILRALATGNRIFIGFFVLFILVLLIVLVWLRCS